MPHFRIETNVPKTEIPADFVKKVIPVLAKALGKPEQYCVVSVIPDLPMSFGGSTEPCAIANLMSIGSLGVEQNKKHAKVLFELVEKELGVPKDRMYITFQDEPTANVGFKDNKHLIEEEHIKKAPAYSREGTRDEATLYIDSLRDYARVPCTCILLHSPSLAESIQTP